MSEVSKIINNKLSSLDKIDFAKQFFPNAYLGDVFEWNGIKHFYLASGSTRDTYAHPDFEYVLKVANDYSDCYSMGAEANAFEFYHYLESKESETRFEYVPTRWIDISPMAIQQDFLVVMNIGRATINEIFSGVFSPKWTALNDVFGLQYGFNIRTGSIQIYDYADLLLNNEQWPFPKYWGDESKNFKDFSFIDKFNFQNKFLRKAKELGVFEKIKFCYLSHQEGIILDHTKNEVSADKSIIHVAELFEESFNIVRR